MFQEDLHGIDRKSINRFIMAINSGNHWQLLIYWLNKKSLLFLDPLGESAVGINNICEKWR